jgi:hypothetical protein
MPKHRSKLSRRKIKSNIRKLFAEPRKPANVSTKPKPVEWRVGRDSSAAGKPAIAFDVDARSPIVYIGGGTSLPVQNDKCANLPLE